MNATDTIKDKTALGMSAFVGGHFTESIEIFSEIVEMDPENRLALTTRGSAFLKLEKPQEAIADFDRVIETHPEYAKVYHLRGLAKEKAGDSDGAMSDFDRAVKLDPEYGAAYFSRANLHTKMGNEDLATEDMQTVTHLTHRNVEEFANDNNVWRSNHLRVESMMETELNR